MGSRGSGGGTGKERKTQSHRLLQSDEMNVDAQAGPSVWVANHDTSHETPLGSTQEWIPSLHHFFAKGRVTTRHVIRPKPCSAEQLGNCVSPYARARG
jgi:hypothetical protein